MSEQVNNTSTGAEILIVEDSSTQAARLAITLGKHNYRVGIAHDGREALKCLGDKKPDLVISDVIMPEMDGYELCRQISSREDLKDVPVILLTSLADARDVIKGLECGASDFIVKPYREDYLLKGIRQTLARKRDPKEALHPDALEIAFEGDKYLISADRQRILNLLISTYEMAVQRNSELIETQNVLRDLNRSLEKRVEERTAALQASEFHYRSLFDNMLNGYAYCQMIFEREKPIDFVYLEVNKAFETLTGLKDVTGKKVSEVIPGLIESDPLLFEIYGRVAMTGAPERFEKYVHALDMWFSISVYCPQKGYFTALFDVISERKRAEEALRIKSEEIRTMSQQLWQSAKLATMGELAASIAHELNNPMATVCLRIESLQSQLPADDPKQQSLTIIEQETDRMANLVANLLQFSRRSHQHISTIDVCEEVDKTLELIHYHLRNHRIKVVREFSPDVPAIHADRQQLRQLFLNLCANASDAMPQGGTLTLRVMKEIGVTIEVHDTGEGISPENIEKVMEPFFTTKPEGKGTGLGLPICRRIAQEHGGEFEITSEVGLGTTVRICFPLRTGLNGKMLCK